MTKKQTVPVYREFPMEYCMSNSSLGEMMEENQGKYVLVWNIVIVTLVNQIVLYWSVRPGHKNVPNY